MVAGARALQGATAALLAPAALSLLTTTFTQPGERNRALGIYGAIGGSGALIGLLLGGVLTQLLDCRSVLYAILVASASMFGVFLFLTYYLQQTLHSTPITSGLGNRAALDDRG